MVSYVRVERTALIETNAFAACVGFVLCHCVDSVRVCSKLYRYFVCTMSKSRIRGAYRALSTVFDHEYRNGSFEELSE